jgi:hypothetical protein
MDSTAAAILGTAIGAIAAIVSAILAGFFAFRNERLKLADARRAASIAALRSAAGAAFEEMFVLQHAMNWITWSAKNSPGDLTGDVLRQYDEEVHRALPRLLGALVKVAALSLPTYEELRKACKAMYDLEESIALAIRESRRSNDALFGRVAEKLEAAHDFETTIPRQLARVMTEAEESLAA